MIKNKQHNSIVKIILCTIFAATIIFSTALPAFALKEFENEYIEGTPEAPAQAVITKIFKMPLTTPIPKSEFKFIFNKISIDGNTDATSKAVMPNIEITIDYTPDNNGNVPGAYIFDDTDINYNGDGVKSVVKESENILGNVIFTQAGIYKYQIEEIQSGITITDENKEGKSYSKAFYDVEIWVEKAPKNKPEDPDVYFVRYFCVKIVKGSLDEQYEKDPDITGEGKLDPSPGGIKEDEDDYTIEDDFSQLVFTNKYWKTNGGGTENPDDPSALKIKNIIDGTNAVLTEEFYFDVKVTQPTVIPKNETKTYKAYVRDANGTIVERLEFESGTPITKIKMSNGYNIVFTDLHIGSDIEVYEAASSKYIPSYERNFATPGGRRGSLDKRHGFGKDDDVDSGPHYIVANADLAEKTNLVIFTNTREGATPTGISVDDLPYIVLIGIAIVGSIGFVLVSRSQFN